MVAATIANRKDANSQGVTPAPDKSLQENDPQQLTTGPSAFNPRDIRKQIQAGVQAPAATKATDVISAAEAAFEATSLQLREQHQQLSEVAKTTSDLRNGQVRMREEGQKEVAAYEASWSKYNPWSSRFYERGLIEQKNKDNEAADTYAKALEAHEKELKSTLERSQTTLNDATTTFKESQGLRKEADKALERARELAAANKEQEARTEAEKAKELTVRSLERLEEAQKLQQEALRSLPQSEQLRSIPESATAQYQQSIRASSAQLTQIDKQLEQTQEYIRMARNTTIVIGATVATGGLATTSLATTYGVVGAGAIAIGGGTAAGTGIGLAATAAEQGRSVAEGQKTAQAAFQDGLQQTGQDAQVALTTSVATYTGMTPLSKLAPKMTTLLGGSKLAATTSTVASGGIATVPSTLLQEGLDVTVNGKEFGGVADLGGKILKNGIAGGLGTSIGVLGNAARSTNAVRNIAVTGSEGLADATVSVGIEATDAAIRGKEFSSKDAWATFNQAIVGTITGEMSSKAQGRMGRGRDSPDADIDPASKLTSNAPPRSQQDSLEPETSNRLPLAETYGGQGLEIHKTGKAVYVSDAASMKQLYEKLNGPSPHSDKVAAFFDREHNVMVIQKPDATSKESRIIGASFIHHEYLHSKGMSEANAYRGQREFLRKNGMDLSFDESVPVITREPVSGGSPEQFEVQLETFLADRYSASELAGKSRLAAAADQEPTTSAHHNPDAGTPRTEDIQAFLESEMARNGTFGDPKLDEYASTEVAQYMHYQLVQLGELAPEAMLLLRANKRMGTKINGVPLGQLLEDPDLIVEAIYQARHIYTDSTNGPIYPITSSYPRTAQELQSLNDLLTTVGQDLDIGTVTIGERRARLGGLALESSHPDISLRYDNPHTIKFGRRVSPEKVLKDHGPGGDMPHIDAEKSDLPAVKYFKGEDDVVYKFEDSTDPKKRSLYRRIDGKSGKEWQKIRNHDSHSYRKIAEE